MADLIDRQAAIALFEEKETDFDAKFSPPVKLKFAQSIANVLKKLPAVDAVEVCRCKDCRHGAKDDLDGTYQCVKDAEYDEDTNMYFGFSAWHEADFFCGYGKRREDDV